MPIIDYRTFHRNGLRMTRSAGGTTAQVTNRVWYVPGGYEVRWQTATPDTSGASYPGPGTFGVDTTDFAVDDPRDVS